MNLMNSGLKKAIYFSVFLIATVLLLRIPNIKFGFESAVFFATDPVIRIIYPQKNIIDFGKEIAGKANSGKPVQYQGIYAPVLKIPPAVSFGTILVAAGKRNGVNQGMKAVFGDGVFVGLVSEVFDSFSRINMLSSFGQTSQVRLLEVGQVIAEGLGGASAKIELPRDIKIEIGEPVYMTSDLMYFAGFISEVDLSGTKPIAEARLILPFNINELDYVLIVP